MSLISFFSLNSPSRFNRVPFSMMSGQDCFEFLFGTFLVGLDVFCIIGRFCLTLSRISFCFRFVSFYIVNVTDDRLFL